MNATILGLGTAVPEGSIAQADALALARGFSVDAQHVRLLDALYRRSAVSRRATVVLERANGDGARPQRFYAPARDADDRGPTTRVRLERYELEAAPLALRSARAALDESGVAPRAVSHLVTVSCTGFSAPGVDVALVRGLGLDPAVARTNIGFMGCHGAINGLRAAAAYARENPRNRVLVTAVELCSLHFQYGSDPQQAVANALFADGAASALVGTVGPARGWAIASTTSLLLPDCEDAMTWRVSDHGFEMSLSPRVPVLIEAHLRGWVTRWLGAQGLRIADVGSWAIHPGGPRVISTVSAALGLDASACEASRAILGEHGNMSSPTVLFIVDRLRRAGRELPCVALAFGPGLTAEAALFTADAETGSELGP